MNARFAHPFAAALALLLAPAAYAAEPRLDLYGDPLPAWAVARLGTVRFRAAGEIQEVRVSPDGKRIAARSGDDLLVLEAADGRVLIEARFESSSRFAWLPDGRGVLLVRDDPTNPRLVEITDKGLWALALRLIARPRAGAERHKDEAAPPAEAPGPFAFSPDGRLLAAETYDPLSRRRVVTLREVVVGKRFGELNRARDLGPAPGSCVELLFTRDGTALAAVCASGNKDEHRLVLWDLATGKERCRRTVPAPNWKPDQWNVALSPDGNWLAVALRSGPAQLFDLVADRQPRSFARYVGQEEWLSGASAVAFSPDGKLMVTRGHDGILRGWDPVALREVSAGNRPEQWLNSLDFSPDGKRLVSSGRGTMRFWDTRTLRELEPAPGHWSSIEDLAVSPDGTAVATVDQDGTLRVWDRASSRQLRRIDLNGEVVDRLGFVGGGKAVLARVRDTLGAWDLATGEPVALPGNLAQAKGTVRGTGGGRNVVMADDVSVSLWDWHAGRRRASFQLGTVELPSVGLRERASRECLSPDGRLLVASAFTQQSRISSFEDFSVTEVATRVWDVATGKCLGGFGGKFLVPVFPLVLPGGRAVLLGVWTTRDPAQEGAGPPPVLGLWDARTGKRWRDFELPEGIPEWSSHTLQEAALSPDGRTLALATEAGVVLYEVSTGRVRRHFTEHGFGATRVAFTPDARRLVTDGWEHAALVWDVGLAGARAQTHPRTDADRRRLWARLAEAPARPAFEAMRRLYADQPGTVAFLRERLRPAADPAGPGLERLFADLESDRFAVRRRAAAWLDKLGPAALEPVRERLGKAPSEHSRELLRRFIDRQATAGPTSEELREGRAVELLEGVGTPEAKALLRELAQGAPEAPLTQEAAAALRRLGK